MRTNQARIVRVLVAAALAAGPVHLTGQTISVDRATEYQQIDGFGGFSCIKTAQYKQGPFYIDAPMPPHYDTLAYDLGATLIRFELAPTFQPSEGAAYTTGGSVFCGPDINGNIAQMREFAQRGVTRFMFTVWSPPGWMKPAGVAACGTEGAPSYGSTTCKLDVSRYDDFGRYVRDYLKMVEDSTGITPYAVSLQNEPRFTQPFNSCVYDAAHYRDVHKTAGPIIRAEFPNIQFYGTEDLFGWHLENWLGTLFQDATAKQYFDIVAGHYGDAGEYAGAWNVARPQGRKVWGSEEYHDINDATTVAGAVKQAARINDALVSGHCSGWVIWVLAGMFDDNRQPHWTYYGCK
ncbi:MAG: hypothetical protein GF331_12925, partial [Chitinivibrionales bacterium]|nr:hypothetical protein [Chitinivibrionales bacterium]